MKLMSLLWLVLCIWPSLLLAEVKSELRIPKGREVHDSAHDYFTDLMLKALNKAARGRPVPVLVPTMEMAQQRIVRELKSGRTIDIFWLGGTRERAMDLLAIPIPLERGLIGYRQFIVRKDRAADFDSVNSIADLARFKACVGSQWVDAEILKNARLTLVTSVGHENLFKQLAAGRCDYFPRAVHEAKNEMANRAAEYPELMVYDRLLLHYPFAVYFFVRKEDRELADWLTQGLEQMIDTGEFLANMKTHPHTRLAFPLNNYANKRLLTLPNPDGPQFAEGKNLRYWFQPADFGLTKP